MEKKFLDESSLTYLRNYIDGQDKVIYKTAADLVSSTHLESLTRPTTQPTSQLIPSITTTNEQQNLTIGDGLTIENGVLKTTGSGGKNVPPTLNLLDLETNAVRTTITEEEKTNLENGLYNQVMYYTGNDSPSAYSPSKLFNVDGEYGFAQFKIFANADGTLSYSSMVINLITIGEKNTSNEYPITVSEEYIVNPPSASDGSSKIWYELPSLFFLENITQKQFDEIKNLALQNQLAGINCAGLYCPLTAYIDGQGTVFSYPWYENDIFTAYLIRLDADLSVKKIPYSTITLPQTAPTSQLIPSITTSNEQQNLTIGDGLAIENGVIKEDIIEINVSFELTQEDLQAGATWKTSVGSLDEGKKIWNSINSSTGLPKKAIINISLNLLGITDLYKILANPYKDNVSYGYNFNVGGFTDSSHYLFVYGAIYINDGDDTIDAHLSFNQNLVQ